MALTLVTSDLIHGLDYSKLTGTITTWNQDTTGNADTATLAAGATILATARNIGGVSFNGSVAIDLPGVNAAGNQPTSGNAGTVTNGVYTVGDQTIGGVKTFSGGITQSSGTLQIKNASGDSSGLKLYQAGSDVSTISNHYAGDIAFNTANTSQKMIIKNSGKVGIGTTSPTVELEVNGSLLLNMWNSPVNERGIFFRRGFTSSDKYNSSILTYDHNGSGGTPEGISINGYDGVTFCTGSNNRQERMRITLGGDVGIGTDNPNLYYSGADNLVIKQASGAAGISVVTDTSSEGSLYFADGTSGGEQYRGGIAYNHSSDNLFLVSGGATKVTISSGGLATFIGSVDVGGSYLAVSNSSDPTIRCTDADDANYAAFIKFDTTNNVMRLFPRHAGTYYDSNLVLDRGNVGIGTASPATELQIGDYTDATQAITIATTGNGTGRINFYDNNDTEGGLIEVTGKSGGSTMTFAGRWNVDNPKVTFDLVNGNVGIGTTSPDSKLHVQSGSAGSVTSYSGSTLTLETSGDNNFLSFLSPSTKNQGILFGDSAANWRGQIQYNHSNDSMVLYTAASPRLTIASGGNATFNSELSATRVTAPHITASGATINLESLDFDKFYPVTLTAAQGNNNYITHFELSKIYYTTGNSGGNLGTAFLSLDIIGYTWGGNPIHNIIRSVHNGYRTMIGAVALRGYYFPVIWLRGSYSYTYRSNTLISPVVKTSTTNGNYGAAGGTYDYSLGPLSATNMASKPGYLNSSTAQHTSSLANQSCNGWGD